MVSLLLAACLLAPLGPVLRPFAPVGDYAGHWGVDVGTPLGSVVASPIDGVVSFAGSVVGTSTVTVRSGRHRVSISYLDRIDVRVGTPVRMGDPIGRSGLHDGRPAIHVSVRVGETYVDPTATCRPAGALRLLPPMLAAPGSRFDPATSTVRRHIRPPARRSSGDRPGGLGAVGGRRDHVPAGG